MSYNDGNLNGAKSYINDAQTEIQVAIEYIEEAEELLVQDDQTEINKIRECLRLARETLNEI